MTAQETDRTGLVRLSEEECWDFLRRHSLGRIAVIHMDNPVVFPVNYAVDDHHVVFRTAPGTKLAQAAAWSSAAFEVDEASPVFETGTSVVVHGRLQEITDAGEVAVASRLPLRPWAPGDRDHFVRVVPAWVTGRRIPVHHLGDDGLAADAG